jgi:hypothetical protein
MAEHEILGLTSIITACYPIMRLVEAPGGPVSRCLKKGCLPRSAYGRGRRAPHPGPPRGECSTAQPAYATNVTVSSSGARPVRG